MRRVFQPAVFTGLGSIGLKMALRESEFEDGNS
jgi:hypothetical protein